MKSLFRLLPLVAALSAVTALPAHAQSLVELYEAARTYDASFQSAKLQYDATLARAEQSRAGTLPTVGLAMAMSRSHLNSSARLPNPAFGSESATVSASQPLYRPANQLTFEQGKKSIESAQAQLQVAEQDLVVRISQAYFDVLAAQDAVAFVAANKTAVSEQLASAKRNFEVGTSTITDTREAQARFDLVTAQQIAAENDLLVKRLALDQLVGRPGTVPKPLLPPVALPALLPPDVTTWINQAIDEHPVLRQAAVALEVAQLETRKAQAGNLPTLDLNGSFAMARNDGSSTTRVNSSTNTTSVALAFNLPLFAGYAIQNRIKETIALEDKARSDLEAARRTISQNTRAAFFGVLSGQGQVKALEAAEASSQSALDANKLGYQVGVRINIDVLNAQSQLFQTKRDLARARYDVLVGGLRLRQANGSLKPDDIQAINSLLVK
ncbi:MAG: TolC family outer membrane protein [Rhodoferax sp.]|jgi:outer membrane protein|nr:TolC family outer membrane protein [Rhodoferax sp.]